MCIRDRRSTKRRSSDAWSPSGPAPPGSRRLSSTEPGIATTAGSRRSPTPRGKPVSTSKRRRPPVARIDPTKLTLEERVVQINRVAKVVKGGRRFSFSAVVIVGDGHGHVGAGLGKAGEVPEAIRKGVEDAKKNLIRIPTVGTTITHEGRAEFAAARLLLKPASHGTGVIAGGSVRAVVEAAGIRDILSKVHGSTNPVNVVRATIEALRGLSSAEEISACLLYTSPSPRDRTRS